jgi:catechol 2,3-dioxygenase-like lactoylglutathione lyase family enzyme
VSHVSFAVRDLERSLAFYRDLLGLVPVERPDFGFAGAWLAAGDAQVHLIVVPEGTEVGTPVSKLTPLANHTAFVVDDLSAAVAALRERGLAVVGGGSLGQAWVQDPDGNVIEFATDAPR